ncbi:MAG: hypothetical protein ABW171_02575 [Steroidobacter sp.]
MSSSFRRLALGLLLICMTASAQYNSRGPEIRPTPPIIPANAKDIVLKGEQVCLRRLPDSSGRILLDCAIGLRGDDDQFYGLRSADPTRLSGFPEMNLRVRVVGKLIPHGSGEFEEAGQIIYTTIAPIDEPKAVTGTVVCLYPRAPGSRSVKECRNVIKTDRGLRWGLDLSSLDARGLAPGDRISLEGDVVRNVPEDWHPWMFLSDAERIEGILKVRSLK